MSKRPFPHIQTERVRLRLLEQRDLPMTLGWRNREDIRRWFFHSDVIPFEEHAAWFDRYRERDDDFVFVIEEAAPPRRPIGQASLYHVDWAAGTAEFGRLLIGEPEAAGKGLAKEATKALVDAAFARLGLQEVYLEARAANARAIRLYLACAFCVTHDDGQVVRMNRKG